MNKPKADKRMIFFHTLKEQLNAIQLFLLFVLFAFSPFISNAQDSEVIISVNWPSWSSDNRIQVYSPSDVLLNSICNPSSCYNASTNNSYVTSINIGCLPDGAGYYLVLQDYYGDGWNGSGTVSVTSGGSTVINNLGLSSGSSSGPHTFTVSGGGATCNILEICDNGVDDDGDGTTDLYDPDCNCGTLENLALGMTATQSSDYNGSSGANLAIDGTTDGDFNNGSVTHTTSETNAWWEVDLGNIEDVNNIRIWNRTDCCQDRLSNFYVFVSDRPFTSNDPVTTAGQVAVWSELVTAYPTSFVVVSPYTTGRYIRIQLTGSDPLSLAEVEIIGCQNPSCPWLGTADSYTSQTDITNPMNAIGSPDGAFAEMYHTSDQIVLDFSDQIPENGQYTIRWRKGLSTSSDPSIQVEESANGAIFTPAAGSPFTFSNQSFFDHVIAASHETRYIRLTSLNNYDVDLDAISYDVPCEGTGGSNNILDTTLCYYISDVDDIFYSVNPVTGVSSAIGHTGTSHMENLCIDPYNEIIYGMDHARLGTINETTGAWTAIASGNIGNLDGAAGTYNVTDVDGLSFDVTNDILWASGRMTGQGGDAYLPDDIIFQVDKNTGLPIYDAFGPNVDYLVISTPEDDIDDISIHIDGTLYAISNRSGSGNQRLININKTDGTYTLIGDYGVSDVEGMGVTASGQLLVTTGQNGVSSQNNRLWTIDPLTGIAELVGALQGGDIEGCACKHTYYANSIISGNVWEDTDKDGIQDVGEPWLSGITVNLLNNDGSPVIKNGFSRIASTDANGYYEFKEVFAGDYKIEVIPLSGRFFTSKDSGSDDDLDSDVAPSTGQTSSMNILAGEKRDNVDAGILPAGESLEICDNNIDDDNDGLIDCNDPNCYDNIGVSDDVSLEEGTSKAISVVDNDLVSPGTWTVSITGMLAPSNGTLSYVSPGYYDYTPDPGFVGYDQWEYELCYLCGCDTVLVNVEVFCTAIAGTNEISGRVWLDPDMDGYPDANELYRSGATIRYYEDINRNDVVDGGDVLEGTVITDVNGYYSFTPSLNVTNVNQSVRISEYNFDQSQEVNGTTKIDDSSFKFKSDRPWQGAVFEGVNIPSGATITSAHLNLTAKSDKSDNCPVTIYGIRTVNPGEWTEADYEVSGRPRTTNSVSWSVPTVITDNNYNSPSLVSIIQEIVDMPGYESGNGNIGLIVNSSTGERNFRSYDDSPTEAPLLVVSYAIQEATDFVVHLDTVGLADGTQYTTPQTVPVSFPSLGESNCLVYFGIVEDEICDNNIDDDGDGLVDCADPDCFNNLLANASTSDADICTGLSTNVNAAGTGGTSPYTYAWSHSLGSGSSKSVNPVVNTTYTVTITDANGCSNSEDVTITVFGLPTANAGSNTTICEGENTTLSASGGTTYSWSHGLGSGSSKVVNPTSNTTYTVTVTDGNGCTDTDEVTVFVDMAPIVTASPDDEICNGLSTTISASASSGSGGGYTYAWSHGLGSGASKSVNPTTTTVYTVTVTDGRGCTDSDQVTVTVNASPNANAGNNTSICINSGVTLNASGGVSYSWSPSLGLSATNINNPIASPTVNTTYTVVVTDGNGCTDSDQITISVNALPTVDAGTNATICSGGSTVLSAVGSGGSGAGYTYSWSHGLGSGATKNVTPSTTTKYTVTISDGNMCTSTDEVIVVVQDLSQAGQIEGNESGCDNYDPVIMNAVSAPTTDFNGGLSDLVANYDFNNDILDASGNGHNGTQIGSLSYENGVGNRSLSLDGSNGNYVSVVDHNDLKPAQITVSAWLKPSAATPATYETAVFKSSDGNWTDGYGLAHYEGSSNINFYVNNWETKVVSSPLPSGVYSHVVGTYDGITLNLYINGLLTSSLVVNEAITYISDPLTIGYGDGGSPWNGGIDEVQIYNRALDLEEVQILYNLHNDIEYQWEMSTDGTNWSDISGANSESYDPGIITQTTHYRRKSRINPCTSWLTSGSVIKTVNSLPLVDAGSDVTICPNSSVSLGASGGVSYAWSPSTGLNSTNIANPVASPSATTTYVVTVTDANGCTNTDEVTITLNPMTLSRDISRVSCPGESDGAIDLTIDNPSGSYTVDWDIDGLGDNDDTEDLSGLSAGVYTVVVTDQNCSDTLQITLGTVNDYPYSALILTDADATSFPTSTVPGGYFIVFPTSTDTFDFTFDHEYIEDGFVLDSNWTGGGRLTYEMYDANPASNLSHSVGDRTTEFHDFNPGDIINESGRVYDVYGRGHFSISAGSTQNHGWKLTYDFSHLDKGYLPAGTLIGFVDIDGLAIANESIILAATLESGATTSWLDVYDKAYNPPKQPHGEATYIAGNNTYYFNGPDASNTAIAYTTSEDLTSITMTLTQGFSGSSYGLKFAAPIHPLEYEVVPTDPNCIGNNGSISIYPELAGVSYSIDGGTNYQSSSDFTGLAAGTYNIFIQNDSSGCITTYPGNPITLDTPLCIEFCNDGLDNDDDGLVDCDDPDCYNGFDAVLTPSVMIASEGLLCLPGSIEITAVASGGDGIYAYLWDNGLGSGPSHTVSPTSATTYNVTIIDGNGCEAYDQVTVNVHNSPVITVSADSVISCSGVGANISASGGSTYQWAPIAGLSDPNISNPVADPTISTMYRVTATDVNGCTGVDSVYVEVTSNVGNANAGVDETICQGEGVMLSASGGVSYMWSPSIGLSDNTIANPIASPTTTRIYSVIATDENGCTDVDQVQVTVLSNPNASITQDSIEICLGTGTNLFASGGGSYSWSPSNGLSATNIANPSAMPFSTTTYTVLVTDGNGCTDTDEVVVVVNDNTGNADAGMDQTICNGESANLQASGGVLFQWSPSTGLNFTNVSNPIASPSTTTTYTVIATDENGCTDADVITINVEAVPNVTTNGNQEICEGESIGLSAGGGISYNWSPALGLSSTSISNPIASPTSTTTYTVIVTDNNGCTASSDIIVTVNSLPLVSTSHDSLEYCTGVGGIQISATGGVSYSWAPATGLSDPNISNPIADPTTSTDYVVDVVSAAGCITKDTIHFTVYSNEGNANAGPDVEICRGESTTLNASGGVTYSWTPTSGLNRADIYNPIASPTSTTTYTVIATDENGCTDVDVVEITVQEPPTADAGLDHELCLGESVTLSATGGISYSWSPTESLDDPNSPNPVATPFLVTTYTVVVTDVNGCTASDETVVTVYPVPQIDIAQDTFIICGSSSASFDVSGGTSYAWSPSEGLSATDIANPIANPSTSTLYTVTVTNVWGCESTGTIYVDKDATGDIDNDGICFDIDNCPDMSNGNQLDTDGDGVGDACDADDDNDGITDVDEIATAGNGGDTDGDGIPDHLDLDSDNDGIPDLVEGGIPEELDLNFNGSIDLSNVFGENGFADDLETEAESGLTSLQIPNTDGQSGPNFQDLDSEDDGFCDLLESGINPDVYDIDHNGVLDGLDSDGDGILDILDTDDVEFGSPGHHIPRSLDNSIYQDYVDSDRDDALDFTGDGIDDDVAEAGYLAFDTNNDGQIDFSGDTDYDGIVDNIDTQVGTFGGLCDEVEDFNLPPVAIADIYYTDFEEPFFFSPTINDFDTDGTIDSSTFTFITLPPASEGNAIFNEGSSSIFFVPASGFQGQTTFKYTIDDNDENTSNVATVTIVIGNPGLIVTSPDVKFTQKNTPIDISVLQNDFSTTSQLDTSSLALMSSPPHGLVSIPDPGMVRYIPNNDFEGIDNFLYQIDDIDNNTSNPTNVEVFVYDTLDLVLALDDVFRLKDTITMDVSDNDLAFPSNILPTTISITKAPDFGTISILPDGKIRYTAYTLFDGTDYIKYTIMDDEGKVSNEANIILLINKDTDGDGVPDNVDLDDDNDGILDIEEIANALFDGDSDQDGIPDQIDLDSDNDGTNDVIEGGRVDSNGDGMADGIVNAVGIATSVATSGDVWDTDGDLIPNYLDLDSDADGVSDLVESGNVLYVDIDKDGRLDDPDADSDGIPDIADNLSTVWGEINDYQSRNTDADDHININDSDDDNDGVLTIEEDTNLDGDWNNDDTDEDNVVDYLDPDLFVFLDIKVFLQGPYVEASSLMRDDLRKQGYLPFTEPYTDLGYNFHRGGGETVNPSVFQVAGPDAIVDWVIIELRDSSDHTMMSHSIAALLQRDGDIVDLDGVSRLKILNRPHRRYKVGVKHRNHLGVMTAEALMLNHSVNTIDFTRINSTPWEGQGFATTNYPMKVFSNERRALWAGNVDFNSKVLFQGAGVDPAALFSDVLGNPNNEEFLTNFILTGYQRGDVNMDGRAVFQGSPNDVDIIFFNNILHPENVNLNANFIINQQVPNIDSLGN